MLCENCGSNVDGMKFCKNCGKKVENASAEKVIMPTTTNGDKPTNTPKSDLKTMGYIFVFWPLAATVLTWIFSSISLVIIIGLNFSLWYADKAILKQDGYTGKWTWWAIFFPPVYLYFRCKHVDGNFKKLKQHIVVLLIDFILALIIL